MPLHRLDSALAYRLTLLVAPAGYGKSALLKQWTNSLGCPFAWVTLSKDDNKPAQFLADLIGALQTVERNVTQVLASSDELGGDAIVSDGIIALINALADVPEDFTLVLDKYDLIDSPLVHRLVELFLDYPPPKMHLVIASRTEPPLSLPRLRGRRQLLTLWETAR